MADESKRYEVEIIKDKSNYLRGTLVESLQDEITGAISEDDQQLIKFHGTYQQYDRDLESERKKQKLEPLYSFMIRIRMPAGIVTAKQWLEVDKISDKYTQGTLKLSTRQAFELHGVLKRNLKNTIKAINDTLLNTIAACGDVVRNVMATANPSVSEVHEEVHEVARDLSVHFEPKTTAYHEIWMDKKLVAGGKPDEEPVYGKHYLPRKFKITIAVPPINDTDVFAHDIGLIAIVENGKLTGFNFAIGGGMGMTFGMPETYPRLATIIGYVPKANTVEVAEEIVKIQRDNGNRENRKQARLKYTFDRMGYDAFVNELHKRLGYELEEAKPYEFKSNGDPYGWKQGSNGNWNVTLFVEGGRVQDTDDYKLKSGLREIAYRHQGEFILTGNQNLVIANITPSTKDQIEEVMEKYGINKRQNTSGLRLNSLACVALNLCPLAMADAERYLPSLIDKMEALLTDNGLAKDEITIRMTGCPNGCARPYISEIAFVGRSPGRYNMYLGGGFAGERLNRLYKEMLNEEEILAELKPMIEKYAKERLKGEKFGDFLIKKGYIKAMKNPKEFQMAE
jgi:sulfite reductase (NADPH) hemoprotein beta-component